MTDHTRLLLSGSVFPDVNHERLFLRVRHGTRVQFSGGSIDGDRVLRLVDNLDIAQAALEPAAAVAPASYRFSR